MVVAAEPEIRCGIALRRFPTYFLDCYSRCALHNSRYRFASICSGTLVMTCTSDVALLGALQCRDGDAEPTDVLRFPQLP